MKTEADEERLKYTRYLWEKACEVNTFSDQDFMDGYVIIFFSTAKNFFEKINPFFKFYYFSKHVKNFIQNSKNR